MYTCLDSPTVCRNSFEAQWTEPEQLLTEMIKLQHSGKGNNHTPYGGLSFWVKQRGKERGNRYSRGEGQVSILKKIGSRNQDSLLGQEIGLAITTPHKACPESRYDNVEAPERSKNIKGRTLLHWRSTYALTSKERERELRTMNIIG